MEFGSATVVAVSKLQPIEKIRTLYQKGHHHFGENYVQEALEKIENLKDLKIHWHFIGRIQKNKIKFLIGKFDLIHSVDSLDILNLLDQKNNLSKQKQKILLQINLAKEDSKGGFQTHQIASALEHAAKLQHVEVCGFMTMPPLFDDAEKNRPFFQELQQLLLKYQTQYPQLKELSMGTSNDYKVALEEGATIIRLGTILFGERVKNVSI